MNDVARLAIVDPNDVTRSTLKNLLLGVDSVWLEAECSRYEFFIDVAAQTKPDITLIALDADSEKALALLAELTRTNPECSPLVVSSSQEGSLILRAMRSGAKEFLAYPLRLEDFLAALDRIRKLKGLGEHGETRRSQVLTVGGVVGGVGCTSIAVNLACMLARNESNSVAILDLDLALGDADVWLDIIPDFTIQDVAENITRLDYSLLKRSLTRHDCGVFLLPRPVQIDDVTRITPDELRRIIALLKATFSHLVIDISKSYTPLDLAAMDVSDDVLLVTQLDLPGLRNVVRLTQHFEFREMDMDKIKVVINRVGLEDTQISLNKAQETIGREVFAQIPNEYAVMVESRNNGVPLITQAPKAKVTRAFEQLIAHIDGLMQGDDAKPQARQKKGLFSFLGGQK
ncbi:MAG: CpaE family protein [Planctomycetaceae bacterium]